MMTRKSVVRTLGLALILGGIGLAGCEDNDGPVEDAAEEVGEAVDDATD